MVQYEGIKSNEILNAHNAEECPLSFKDASKNPEVSNYETRSIVLPVRDQIDHFVTFKGLESQKIIINGGTNLERTTNRNDSNKSNYLGKENTQLILNQVNIHDHADLVKERCSSGDKCDTNINSNHKKLDEKPKLAQSKHLKRDKPPFKYAGIIASLMCALFFSVQSVAIKLLPNPHSINEKAKALFFRGFFILVFCTITCIYNKTSLRVPRDEIWVNFLRCITGAISQFGAFSALAFISAADSKAIIFTAPIWTSIASRFVFNDQFKLIQVFALPATMFGIVLVAHPSLIVGDDSSLLAKPLLDSSILYQLTNITLEPENDWLNETFLNDGSQESSIQIHDDGFTREKRWIGFAISLGVSLMATANYIVLTFRRKTPVQTTTFWLGLTVLATSLSVMAFTGYGSAPDTIQEWILLVTIGFTAWVGQSLLQWAFLYERADILSIVRTTDVAFTFLLSALVLDEPLYGTSIIGALIITSVVILLILNDLIQKMFCSSRNYSIRDISNDNNSCDKNDQQIYTISSGKSSCSDMKLNKT